MVNVLLFVLWILVEIRNYLTMYPEEMNPFLGYRAIRLCLAKEQDVFRTQLKSIMPCFCLW